MKNQNGDLKMITTRCRYTNLSSSSFFEALILSPGVGSPFSFTPPSISCCSPIPSIPDSIYCSSPFAPYSCSSAMMRCCWSLWLACWERKDKEWHLLAYTVANGVWKAGFSSHMVNTANLIGSFTLRNISIFDAPAVSHTRWQEDAHATKIVDNFIHEVKPRT